MIRKLNLSLLLCSALLSTTNAYAITNHTFSAGSSIEYSLPVGEPQLFSNPLLWTVKVTCTILSRDDENYLSFKVTRKTGTLNGKQLSVGDSMNLSLRAKEKIYITAVSGAEVEMLNIGNKEIKTQCIVS